MNALIIPTNTSEWAAHIAACWSVGVKAIMETGRLLLQAKACLDHGQFGEMIEAELPFTASTAERLMIVASDPKLSNPAHVQHLPPHWGTLYEISKLDDQQFGEALTKGVIRPDVERQEIVALRKSIRNAPAQQAYQDRVDAGCTLADLVAHADSGAQYSTILADPNWQYETWSEKGKGRSPDNHYRTDVLDPINALPVKRLAAKNSVLHLWCLDCMLPQALEVIDAWGFTFIKIGFHWVKQNPNGEGLFMGLGHWTRDGAEVCLFATKGHPVRRSARVRQVIMAPVGRHSEKPAEAHKRIMELTGGPYLELFARETREGWVSWGDEIPRATFLSKVTPDRGEERPPAAEATTSKHVTQNQNIHERDGSDAFEIPAFLRRQSDSDSVPVASPRKAHLVSAGDGG